MSLKELNVTFQINLNLVSFSFGSSVAEDSILMDMTLSVGNYVGKSISICTGVIIFYGLAALLSASAC